jgi:hypothetical protein
LSNPNQRGFVPTSTVDDDHLELGSETDQAMDTRSGIVHTSISSASPSRTRILVRDESSSDDE